NESGIVDISRGAKIEDGIVVDEVEELFRSQGEADYDLARFEGLARARNHAVGNQFAVHAQILAIAKELKYGIGNASNARLQNRSVLNQAGHIAPDGEVQVTGHRSLLQFAQRP